MKIAHTLILTIITPLPLLFQATVIPIAIRKHSTINASSITTPGLEKTSTIELLRHSGTSFNSAFCIAFENGASPIPSMQHSSMVCFSSLTQYIHSIVLTSLSFLIPSCTMFCSCSVLFYYTSCGLSLVQVTKVHYGSVAPSPGKLVKV